jgi:hypothetical protein
MTIKPPRNSLVSTKGPSVRQGLALLLTYRRGSLRGVQARPARNVRAGEDGSDPRLDYPSLLRSGLLGAVDQQGVLHDAPVLGSATLRLLDELGAGERTRPGENFGSGCPSGDPSFVTLSCLASLRHYVESGQGGRRTATRGSALGDRATSDATAWLGRRSSAPAAAGRSWDSRWRCGRATLAARRRGR